MAQRSKRFDVYRNNVHASLASALAARFPIVQRVVGEEFFRAMALVFVRQQLPRSPVLAEYGGDFPDFLEGFAPAAELAYLADVARLEWMRHRAYHAADAGVCGIDALAALDGSALQDVRLTFHPATAIVCSAHPIVSIWSANTHDVEVGAITPCREAALVTRPDLDVLVTPLASGMAVLISALMSGGTLGQAVDAASAACPDLDLGPALAIVFSAGAVVAVSVPSPDCP